MTARLAIAALVALAAMANGRDAVASGGVFSVSGHGLHLTVDTTWLDGQGYRPIRIIVKPMAPQRTDRRLTLEFLLNSRGQRETRVVHDVVLPKGASEVVVSAPIPDANVTSSMETTVFEAGRELPHLKIGGTVSNGQVHEGLPNLLFVDTSMPDHSPLAQILPTAAHWAAPYGSTGSATPTPTFLQTALNLPPEMLPERWIEYSALDVVSISLERLRRLASDRPRAWAALRQWVRAGGNLWVHGVGESDRAELSTLLSTAGDDWRAPSPEQRAPRILDTKFGPKDEDAVAIDPDGSTEVIDLDATTAPPQSREGADSPFVWRNCGLGSVVALSGADVFPGDAELWAWVLNEVTPDRWLNYRRQGLSNVRGNSSFWNFLIPGVGFAPITAFRVVITAFVLLIGPLNYFFLQRRGQLQWLLLTVPAAALLVTSGMFLYAMFSDGIRVRCRARSYTWLDQRQSATAVTWSRLSYYAGLAPAGGLEFSDQTAVYRLQAEPSNDDDARRRTLVWRDGRQRLASGWLVSRRTTQFVTVRAADAAKGIALRRRADGALQATNGLGSPLLGLLVCDSEGKLHGAIAPEKDEFLLAPQAAGRELEAFVDLIDRHPPELPPDFDDVAIHNLQSRRRYYYYYGVADQSQTPLPDLQTSILERRLLELRAAIAGGTLAPRTFVAILADTGDAELGTPEARPEVSTHVVEGVW